MNKYLRHEEILHILKERQFTTVGYLAKLLYVAPITIRRDLSEMETAGLLKRSHGGASVLEHQNREVPFELREQTNATVKAFLGKQAAALLHAGDVVFMDASTTVLHVIDYLNAEMNLTVVTNSIKALEKLREKHIRCYLTGGVLLENSYALIGQLAEQTISGLYADVCLFSTQGITEDGVITDFSEAETRLRQQMLAHAKYRIYVFDKTKYGKQYLFRVCHTSEIQKIVTDANINDAIMGANYPEHTKL